MRSREPFTLRSLFLSKYFFIILSISILIVLTQWILLIPKSSSTYDEIKDARNEVQELESQQKKLQELNTFLQSDFFAEKEARTKLGMQKKDEHVVVLDSFITSGSESDEKSEKNSIQNLDPLRQNSNEKNTTSWWQYFFGE